MQGGWVATKSRGREVSERSFCRKFVGLFVWWEGLNIEQTFGQEQEREKYSNKMTSAATEFRNIQHCAKLARVPIVAAGMGGLCPRIHGQGSNKRQAGSEKGQQCERQTQVCRSHDTRSGLLSVRLFDGTIRARA